MTAGNGVPADIQVMSAKSQARDVLDRVKRLRDGLEGEQDAGYALFAEDRLEQAIEELEKIDLEAVIQSD